MSGFRFGFRTRKGSVPGFLQNTQGFLPPPPPGAFLLDDVPSASRAYSLRRLAIAYTGNLIKVRRASDNTEQDIGMVSDVLDTSSLTSFCSGTDGFVTTWYDQSGNAINAIQTTAANQPQIVSSGSIITKNSLPTIYFYPGNFRFFLGGDLSGLTAGNMFNVIATQNDPASIEQHTGFHDLGTISTNSHFPWVDGTIYDGTGSANTRYTTANPTPSLTNLGLYEVLSKSSYWQNLYNTTSLFTSSGSNVVGFRATTRIGASSAYATDWYLSEFLLWPADKSADRSTIETNIDNFYALPY